MVGLLINLGRLFYLVGISYLCGVGIEGSSTPFDKSKLTAFPYSFYR